MNTFLKIALLSFIVSLCLSAQCNADSLQRLNNSYFMELKSDAFNGYGDLDFWAKRAKQIAFRSAKHLTRCVVSINSDRQDSLTQRMFKLKKIVQMNKDFASRAKSFAQNGYGDVEYWSKRTQAFATEIGMHTANLAGLCDSRMLETATPVFQEILKKAESSAFNGYGNVSYWSRRCKLLALEVTTLTSDLNTQLAMSIME